MVLGVEQLVLAVMKEKSCLAKRLWATGKSAGISWDLAGVCSRVCSRAAFCAVLGNTESTRQMEGIRISMLDSDKEKRVKC